MSKIQSEPKVGEANWSEAEIGEANWSEAEIGEAKAIHNQLMERFFVIQVVTGMSNLSECSCGRQGFKPIPMGTTRNLRS